MFSLFAPISGCNTKTFRQVEDVIKRSRIQFQGAKIVIKFLDIQSSKYLSVLALEGAIRSSLPLSNHHGTGSTKKNTRILVIDDEADITAALKIVLQGYFKVVDIYNNPLRVVADFRKDLYDLALVDYLMPHMNGFELCKIIRQVDPKVNLLLMTAFEMRSTDRYNKEYREFEQIILQQDCIIKKPFEKQQLIAKINSLVDGDPDISLQNGEIPEQHVKT